MLQIKRFSFFLIVFVLSSALLAQSLVVREKYKVKRKDTVYGISKKFGLTIQQLLDANPEMKQEGFELRHGDYVLIPQVNGAEVGTKSAVNSSANIGQGAETSKPTVAPVEANKAGKGIKIGVMLPLHDVDGDGRRMIEYYRGVLMACEDMKTKGISTDVSAWNVAIDTDINLILKDAKAKNCDIIFGPLYTKQVKSLAQFCKSNHIKMVIPFSISGDDVENYQGIFQVYQSPSQLNQRSIDIFLSQFKDTHPVFIDCNDTTSTKAPFTFGLRKQLEKMGITYSITNLKSSEESFAKAFDVNKRNVVILNTGRSPELTVALNKLDGLLAMRKGLLISLYGYTEWLMYTKYNIEHFHKFDTYIPSTFYYNPLESSTQQLERYYSRWFASEMQMALPRFALTGYDQARYFIQGLHTYGKNFVGMKNQSSYRALQTPLHFVKVGAGGYQNNSFLLVHYRYDNKLELMKY